MSQEKEVDINEAFENILLAEDLATKSAYAEGYECGRSESIEGYHLGYHRASLIAARLGYYSGVLEQYLQTTKLTSPKISALANKLLQDINNFPHINDETVDIMKALEDIKLNYAKFCALAKISSAYPETDKLDF